MTYSLLQIPRQDQIKGSFFSCDQTAFPAVCTFIHHDLLFLRHQSLAAPRADPSVQTAEVLFSQFFHDHYLRIPSIGDVMFSGVQYSVQEEKRLAPFLT